MTLVECVPNFSEGRSRQTITAITGAIESVRGVRVLDVSSDPWHHRSVVTFAGPPDAIVDAAFAAVLEASRRIDLRQHRGQHPRMGATDVVPFVPLEGVTMDECVQLSRTLAERVGDELDIPVFLYERSATRGDRRDLAAIRRGGFEALGDAIGTDPLRVPDFGPPHIHPSAGATAVGARQILVAFNVFLGPAANLPAVREIARALRGSSGGLRGVKALAFDVNGRAQLSMNLTDLEATPAHIAYEAVLREAARHGLQPERSELVGLAPERFFVRAGARALGLARDTESQVIERRVRETGLGAPSMIPLAADAPAGSTRAAEGAHPPSPRDAPTASRVQDFPAHSSRAPEGMMNTSTSAGSAAAGAAALAAQLMHRLARNASDVVAGAGTAPTAAERAESLAARLSELATLDVEAWQALLAAESLAIDAPGRDGVITAAVLGATGIPLEIARSAAELAELARDAGASAGSRDALADAHAVALLSDAAAASALVLIRTNVARLAEPHPARGMIEAGDEFARRSRAAVQSFGGPGS